MSPAPTSLTVVYKASSPFFLKGYQELEAARREGCRDNDGERDGSEVTEVGRTLEGGNKLTTPAASLSLCIPTRFVPEDAFGKFASALATVMAGWTKEGKKNGREGGKEEEEEEEEEEVEEACVMWLVDDLLFHAPFDSTPFLTLLKRKRGGEEGGREGDIEGGERIWAIHSKLHPGISYSHTLDKVRKIERRAGEMKGGRAGGREGGWNGGLVGGRETGLNDK